MSGTFYRGRFYHLPRYEASLSSRFPGIPILLERDNVEEQYRGVAALLNPHPVLPPISYRHSHNHDQAPHLSPRLMEQEMPHPTFRHAYQLEHLHDRVARGIPNTALHYTREEEAEVMSVIASRLLGVPAGVLKSIYIDMAEHDTKLAGIVDYGDLLAVVQKKLPLEEPLLRLVSAMFISHREPGRVNYEKVLSFLGAALQFGNTSSSGSYPVQPLSLSQPVNNHQDSPNLTPRRTHSPMDSPRAVYYHNDLCKENESHTATDLPTERDDPTILRQLEDQVKLYIDGVNFESLRLAFQRSDRLHRGTLSEQQMKELCYDHGLRVHEAVLEKVIRRCQNRGGGQYDWQQFFGFLERVQPLQTGLKITGSRPPAEFVRLIPHPAPNWPHAEAPPAWASQHYHDYQHQQHSPRQSSPSPLYREQTDLLPPVFSSSSKAVEPPPPPPPQTYRLAHESEIGFQPPTKLEVMQREMDALERSYPLFRSSVAQSPYREAPQYSTRLPPDSSTVQQQFAVNSERQEQQQQPGTLAGDRLMVEFESSPNLHQPWFDRFMKLADAMYKADSRCLGSLTEDEVQRLTETFNLNYALNLSSTDMQSALMNSKRKSGRIDISTYLKMLAVKG